MERRHTRRSSSMRESQSDAYAVVMAAKESSRERRSFMLWWCYGEMVRYDVEMVRWWGVEICCGCFCKFTKTYLIKWVLQEFLLSQRCYAPLLRVNSVREHQYSHGIHGTHRTFLPRRAISTNKQYKAYVNTSTQQHYNWYVNTTTSFFLRQKKRTTRITRTGLSKNNVTLIVLNHAKTAIGPKK